MKTICAWCHPGTEDPTATHGICPKHARELLHGHRPDQLAYSAAVVFWCVLAAAMVLGGFVFGRVMAWWIN